MANHVITAAAGQRGVSLDDGLVLAAGKSAVVSEGQYQRLAGLIAQGVLVDGGITTASITHGSDARATADEQADSVSAVTVPISRRALGGKIVFIVDDGQITQRTLAAPKIEAVGGKLNFAITTDFLTLNNGVSMGGAEVTDLYNRGHQIICHSKTHPNMTTQTAVQRQPEWDDSKTILEGLTAVGAITDFVMPQNASNLTTQQEAYGRYLRVFTAQNAPTVFARGENGLHIGRNAWSTTTHQNFLAWIRRIAFTGETYVIFCHSVVTADAASAINQTMLDEAIALASSLGVQWVRADEALVGHKPLFDESFMSGDLTGLYNAITTKSGTSVIDIVTDTPPAGFYGNKSLRMVNDGVGLNRVSVLGSLFVANPNQEYTASVHARQDKTSGTGGAQIFVRQWDEFGNNLGDVNNTALSPANAANISPWTQLTLAFTPNKLTRSLTFWLYQSTMIGTSWFHHPHIAPTRLGVYG